MEENIYLVTPRQEFITGFFPELTIYQDYPEAFQEIPPQQLFAPRKFILGHFVDIGSGVFVLSAARYFTDNPANLAKYKHGISNDRLEIVREVPISKSDLDELTERIKRHVGLKESLTNQGSFGMRVIRNHEADFVNGLKNILEEAV